MSHENQPERLRVYVDGFNLYHGLHDSARCRWLWLDIVSLAERLRPRSRVEHVYYFTAQVLGSPKAQQRQTTYQKALLARHGDRVSIIQGRYQQKAKACVNCGKQWTHREEKETDVNIAVQLVADAAQKLMDSAIIISADSDLVPAVKMATAINPELKILVAFPPKRKSRELEQHADLAFSIYPARIKNSLLPEQVTGADGRTYLRPEKWDPNP